MSKVDRESPKALELNFKRIKDSPNKGYRNYQRIVEEFDANIKVPTKQELINLRMGIKCEERKQIF